MLPDNSSNSTEEILLAVSPIRSFMSVFFILLGIIGNFLVIMAIYRYRNLRTIPNLIILNLSVTDGLFSLIVASLNTSFSWHKKMLPTRVSCHIAGVGGALLALASIYTIVFVSVERFMATNYPLKHRTEFNTKLVKTILFCIWIWCVLLTLLPLLTSRYVYISSFYHCIVDWPNDLPTVVVYGILANILPLIIVAYCNVYVLRAARNCNRIKEIHLNLSQLAEKRRLQRETRISFLIITVVITFSLCWTPYFICMFCLTVENCPLPQEFMSAALVLTMANAACNPVIYGVMNMNFRKAFRGILCCSERREIGFDTRQTTSTRGQN